MLEFGIIAGLALSNIIISKNIREIRINGTQLVKFVPQKTFDPVWRHFGLSQLGKVATHIQLVQSSSVPTTHGAAPSQRIAIPSVNSAMVQESWYHRDMLHSKKDSDASPRDSSCLPQTLSENKKCFGLMF